MNTLVKKNQTVNTKNSDGKEYRVQFTRRYDLFTNVKGNRPLNANHAMHVTKSMRTNGILMTPIIVNEKMEIIDGQHRLYALEQLKKEVAYIMVSGYGAREMQVMNQTQKNWNPTDFMHYFAKKEYSSYVQLRNFMNDYPTIALSSAVHLLSPENGLGVMTELPDGRPVVAFEFGKFEINNWTQGVLIASYLEQISEWLDRKAGSSTFVKMIYTLVNKYPQDFNLDKFIKKMPLMASELRAQGKLEGMLRVVNDLYWKNVPVKNTVQFTMK